MKVERGDVFENHEGKLCVVVYKRGNLLKLSYICDSPHIDPWDMEEFLLEIKLRRFYFMPRTPITRDTITDRLISFELSLIGKSMSEITTDQLWYLHNSLTSIQYSLLKGYAIPLLRKIFKFNKAKANSTFDWFYTVYGLKIKEK
jgi:hypothetical protein